MLCQTQPKKRPPMKTLLLAAATLALLAAPAEAKSLTSAQMGDIFCDARISGDMAPVLAVLTPELAAIVAKALPAGADAATAIPWQSSPDYANACEAVGVRGTSDFPEVVLYYSYDDASKAGYADALVMRFVDSRLRIDDIKYTAGGTLREKLAAK